MSDHRVQYALSGQIWRISPPYPIRGCVNVATQPVLGHRAVGIRTGIGGAISQFGDSLLYGMIGGHGVPAGPALEIYHAIGVRP